MNIWAIGTIGQANRTTIQTTNPEEVLAQLQPGEVCAPITAAQRDSGVILLGDMQVGPLLE